MPSSPRIRTSRERELSVDGFDAYAGVAGLASTSTTRGRSASAVPRVNTSNQSIPVNINTIPPTPVGAPGDPFSVISPTADSPTVNGANGYFGVGSGRAAFLQRSNSNPPTQRTDSTAQRGRPSFGFGQGRSASPVPGPSRLGHLTPPLSQQRRTSLDDRSHIGELHGADTPPSYEQSTPRTSPRSARMMLEPAANKVPLPIYLRSSSPQGTSKKGELKIHIPAWGLTIVNPPSDVHPLVTPNTNEPVSSADTVLTGALEVIMKERRRCQAISVGIQGVCRLHMGVERGWEDDGIFERGVEVLGGDSEGIWLEKGSQTFTFHLLLPSTLATHDFHAYGRVSYIITARVEGVAESSAFALFKREKHSIAAAADGDIPFSTDFDSVIAKSDQLAHDIASGNAPQSRSPGVGPYASPRMDALSISDHSPPDGFLPPLEQGSPSLAGLYHRRQSADLSAIPALSVGQPLDDDRRSLKGFAAIKESGRSEKAGWLKGDLLAHRSLLVIANPTPRGGVYQLFLRKEGFVDGLGTWKFLASSDTWAISGVFILSFQFPQPSPKCTVFFTRVLLAQNYKITSPRTPESPPHQPEAIKNHALYQIGTPHKPGEKCPGHEREALWRGEEAGGPPVLGVGTARFDEGWKTRAVVRMPSHAKIRPSTPPGTITPIRVVHELQLQVFYSMQGETVAGEPIEGPGELRMMAVKMPVVVPSCSIQVASVVLPTYSACDETDVDFNEMLSNPPADRPCLCGKTFAELGEAAMKRMQAHEEEMIEGADPTRRDSVSEGGVKDGEIRASMDSRRDSASASGSASMPGSSSDADGTG